MIEAQFKKKLKGSNGEFVLNISLRLEYGQSVAIMGNSGVGKTTLLKVLAGITQPERGKIIVNNICWLDTEKSIYLPTQKRNIGMVFQDYALFPHLTVKQNIAFGMKGEKQDQEFLNELLGIIGLEQLVNQKPKHLSGGQQQRVALARALARKPSLLLLDEALSALDSTTREQLHISFTQLREKLNFSTLLVTHNEVEAIRLSEKVLILENGETTFFGDTFSYFTNGLSKNVIEVEKLRSSANHSEQLYLAKNNLIKVDTSQQDMENRNRVKISIQPKLNKE